jgi:predicted thioesterase
VVARLDTARTLDYLVTPHDSVRSVTRRGPEFARKPPVMASARLLEVCEWPCMDALRETMQPHQCSLGTRQFLHHCGPIPIGALLTVVVRCTFVDGAYSEWDVQAHAWGDLVGTGSLGFVVVDQAAFERRHLGSAQAARH